jgi:DNA polymerase-3 subunit epsilon
MRQSFAAIDFETADYRPDSACALAVVRAENGRIVKRFHRLIRPPREQMVFSYLHGITWDLVCEAQGFREVWEEAEQVIRGVRFMAAHNVSFDQRVMRACCCAAGLCEPGLPWVCTLLLARREWGIYPTNLPTVCRMLGIPLRHHDPLSDAEACARIVLASGRRDKHTSM